MNKSSEAKRNNNYNELSSSDNNFATTTYTQPPDNTQLMIIKWRKNISIGETVTVFSQ